eukprot:13187910-Heterocapsa_arctica.AAC.1
MARNRQEAACVEFRPDTACVCCTGILESSKGVSEDFAGAGPLTDSQAWASSTADHYVGTDGGICVRLATTTWSTSRS